MARKGRIVLVVVIFALLAAAGAWLLYGPRSAAPPAQPPVKQQAAPPRALPPMIVAPVPTAKPVVSVRQKKSWRTVEDICGAAPAGPSVPAESSVSGATADAVHAVLIDRLHSIRAYQKALAVYRECTTTQVADDKNALVKAQALGNDNRAVHLKQRLDAMWAAYDKTIDDETQVVQAYQDLHTVYCKMGEASRGCPRPQGND
jgi:hypothetical protein